MGFRVWFADYRLALLGGDHGPLTSLGFRVWFADYRLALLGGDHGPLTSRGALGHEADARNLDLA